MESNLYKSETDVPYHNVQCKLESTNKIPDARNGQLIVRQTIHRSGTVLHSLKDLILLKQTIKTNNPEISSLEVKGHFFEKT